MIPEGRGGADTSSCSFVRLSCASTFCGQRMLYKGSPLAGPTAFPWTAALLADGVYVCGATIIHEQFVMTSVFCALKLLRYDPRQWRKQDFNGGEGLIFKLWANNHIELPRSGDYLTVVAGQYRRTRVGLRKSDSFRSQ